MARLGIFIDGGYTTALARDQFGVWIDFEKFSRQVRDEIAADTAEPLDLLRTYYYDCLPYQGNPPTPEQTSRVSNQRRFFTALTNISSFDVREGRLVYRGSNKESRFGSSTALNPPMLWNCGGRPTIAFCSPKSFWQV